MYGVTFTVEDGDAASGSWLAELLATATLEAHQPEEPRTPIPHETTIIRAARTGKAAKLPIAEEDAFHVYFDGRSAGGMGSGGFVGYWPGGACAGGGGGPYPGKTTVNEAEAEALLAALRWVL